VLWRYRVVITSVALMIIALHLVSTGVHADDLAARPASALLEAIAPVQAALNRLFNGASGFVRDYLNLVQVRRENQKLKTELTRLTAERNRIAELEIENRHLSQLLGLRDALGLKAVGANVIGSDASGFSRTLILGQGSDSGLKPGMAVVSAQGVVGKVIATSRHAARVLLIDDHNSALDAFDQRTRTRGIIAGVVDDGLIMKYVGRSQEVKRGDTLVTSGLDGIFPRGLLVGTVKSVSRQGPGLFLSVSVAPAVDFRELEQVMVVIQTPPKLEGEASNKG
jgi:rod shape-determining protein MreC